MRKILIMSSILMMSINAMAEVTDTPCANGGGFVVNGAVQGTYCISKSNMSWFNAYAWCDAMEMQMIDRSEDCGCSDTVSDCADNRCPNFKFDVYTPSIPDPSNTWFWFQNASEHNERACTVNLRENNIYCNSPHHSQRAHAGRRAACK